MPTPPLQIDEELRPFATARQSEFMDAVIRYGSATAAEQALGLSKGLIARSMRGLRHHADRQAALKPRGTAGFVERELTTHYDEAGGVTGSSLKEAPASVHDDGGIGAGPERDGHTGYRVKGVSTYYDASGAQRGQWVKTTTDAEQREAALREALDAMLAEIPRAAPVASPPPAESKLCNLFTITDAHVGMLAWHREGGEDWDLRIAEDTLVGAFMHMILSAPRARVAVVNVQGDFLHQDSNQSVTPAHGHLLDSDSRPRKIVATAIRIIRTLVTLALETHDEVQLIICEGNHDEYTSGSVFPEMFEVLYEREPRVTVNDAALPYYVFEFGQVMLAFHHGHKKKNESLPGYFAAAHAQVWGRTTKRYAHVGHRHHAELKEFSGMKVEQHSTLAARDAYAARGGWMTERQAIGITYHEDFGEVARSTVTPEMLQR